MYIYLYLNTQSTYIYIVLTFYILFGKLNKMIFFLNLTENKKMCVNIGTEGISYIITKSGKIDSKIYTYLHILYYVLVF